MEIENVKKYIGKKVLLVLKNNFKVTTIIPYFTGSSFSTKDKFGINIDIDCDAIAIIQEERP